MVGEMNANNTYNQVSIYIYIYIYIYINKEYLIPCCVRITNYLCNKENNFPSHCGSI